MLQRDFPALRHRNATGTRAGSCASGQSLDLSLRLTVQGPPHIGHIRKEVVFDVLRRWLEHSGLSVTIVANVTDIDDKILSRSAEEGMEWFALAYENERALHAAYEVLGCIPRHTSPAPPATCRDDRDDADAD